MFRCYLVLLGLLAGSSLANLASAAPKVVASAPAIAAPEPQPPRLQVLSLSDMGARRLTQLTGTKDTVDLPFGIPLDAVATRAHLRLYLTASPALIEQLSHLQILLNDQVVAAIALPKTDAGHEVIRDLDLDALHLTDYNHLRLQFIGHYTMDCEDPAHSSLWLSFGNQSRLELELQPLGLKGELGLLPAPFFDRRSSGRLTLPFVFAASPSLETLRAAGVTASWFGALAGYRGAEFPVLLNRLPARHALVFATNAERPEVLQLAPVQRPTISIIEHPADATIKLLVIQGRDGADLQTAVNALVLAQQALSGNSAEISEADIGQRRLAYDAPNWVRTDRPVKLGELIDDPAELQTIGHAPDAIRINLRIAPDLLPWYRANVPMELHYRYTAPNEKDGSHLNIGLNNQFVRALRLKPGLDETASVRLLVPLLNGGTGQGNEEVLIPALEISSDNQMQFQFALDYPREARCKTLPQDSLRASLDENSTIDFSGFPHYTEMPNLALFANAGFPFTKYADLAETVVALPEHPPVEDIETLLFVLGRMGRITGVPSLRYELVGTGAAVRVGNKDLLLIGAGRDGDATAAWGKTLAVMLDGNHRRLRGLTRLKRLPGNPLLARAEAAPSWQVAMQTSGALAAMLGFESPVKSGRSVVALVASAPAQDAAIISTLDNSGLISQIRGDTVLIHGDQVDSFKGEQRYFAGHLSVWQWVHFRMSQHIVLLSFLGFLASLVFTVWAFGVLKRRAARRLKP